MSTTAIVLVAGKGKRMGTKISKQFLWLQGKPIFVWTVYALEQCPAVDNIILVASKEEKAHVSEYCKQYHFTKVCNVIEGGQERQDSVYCALQVLPEHTEIVLIQDGVRPFLNETMIQESIQQAKQFGAVVVGVPTTDTVKICDKSNFAIETPDRSTLWNIQTPQTFQRDLIVSAYEQAKQQCFLGTDDASVAEFAGYRVKVILGSYRNIKITTKSDLLIADAFLQEDET